MNINNLTKRKLKLFINLLGNLIVATVISIIIYFILALFFENTLSDLVARLNYDLYSWIVYNRDIVVYVYIGIVLAVIIYKFISKYVNSINEVYNSLDLILKENNETIKLPSEVNEFTEKLNDIDLILKENNETIKLPSEVNEFTEKLNDIKNDYITSKNNAKEAENKKNDLIMYMAHDLKTPLTSIIGYLTLLNDEKSISRELQEKYIKIALEKSLRVEELTNQFFDITRYNLHTMPINKTEINITYLLKQLIDECYPMLEKNNLKCVLNAKDKVNYLGDGDKLARAFGNLLKNAISYSYKNTTIEINVKEELDNLYITFRNKGDKIPDYKLEKIFEKFYRGDESRTSTTGGAGLGLAITKEIIELHNGKISVKNDDEYIEFDIVLNKK